MYVCQVYFFSCKSPLFRTQNQVRPVYSIISKSCNMCAQRFNFTMTIHARYRTLSWIARLTSLCEWQVTDVPKHNGIFWGATQTVSLIIECQTTDRLTIHSFKVPRLHKHRQTGCRLHYQNDIWFRGSGLNLKSKRTVLRNTWTYPVVWRDYLNEERVPQLGKRRHLIKMANCVLVSLRGNFFFWVTTYYRKARGRNNRSCRTFLSCQ